MTLRITWACDSGVPAASRVTSPNVSRPNSSAVFICHFRSYRPCGDLLGGSRRAPAGGGSHQRELMADRRQASASFETHGFRCRLPVTCPRSGLPQEPGRFTGVCTGRRLRSTAWEEGGIGTKPAAPQPIHGRYRAQPPSGAADHSVPFWPAGWKVHGAAAANMDSHFIDRPALCPDIRRRRSCCFGFRMDVREKRMVGDMRRRMTLRCVSAATGACC